MLKVALWGLLLSTLPLSAAEIDTRPAVITEVGDPLLTGGFNNFDDPNHPEIAKTVPYFQNDTRDVDFGRVYISSWRFDPPNAFVVRVYDDRPTLAQQSWVDVMVQVGVYDDARNLIVRDRRIVRDVPISPGETVIPVYIHNEIGDIIHARVLGVRNKANIKLLD